MNPSVAALLVVTALGGVWALIIGLVPVSSDHAECANARLHERLRALRGKTPAQRRQRSALSLAVALGAFVWLLTGWVLAGIVVPVAVAGLPVLLQATDEKTEIARLEAMSAWTRDLSGVIGAGIGIEQAIRASVATAPRPIRTEVGRLAARLQARWDTDDALRAWAEDIDDATGDLVAAALILGAQRRGAQLASVLISLADTVAEDVRMRRSVVAEQARPRANARIITAITAGGLVFLFLTPYAEPYSSSFGQLVLALYLALYAGCLIWLRRITQSPRQARILGTDTAALTKGGV